MRKETLAKEAGMSHMCVTLIYHFVYVLPAFRFVITVRKKLFRRTIACAVVSRILIIKASNSLKIFPMLNGKCATKMGNAAKALNV